MTNFQIILKEVKEGNCTYGNHNTDFFIRDGVMIMCEYCKDCKYTSFSSAEKFARRINKFLKTGY